jgi:cytoskeletal protein RodZ
VNVNPTTPSGWLPPSPLSPVPWNPIEPATPVLPVSVSAQLVSLPSSATTGHPPVDPFVANKHAANRQSLWFVGGAAALVLSLLGVWWMTSTKQATKTSTATSAPKPVTKASTTVPKREVATTTTTAVGAPNTALTVATKVASVYVQNGLMYVVAHGADVSDAQTSMESARADFVERCTGKNMGFVAPNSGYQVPIYTTIGDMGGHIVSLTGADRYVIKE